jgi:hypothetical protein
MKDVIRCCVVRAIAHLRGGVVELLLLGETEEGRREIRSCDTPSSTNLT